MNNKNFEINAKWTSCAAIKGFTQFRICGFDKDKNSKAFLLIAVCDRNIILRVSKNDLKNSTVWTPGWH